MPAQRVKLLPAQLDFLKAREPEVLYSGAFGAGKTRALCYKLLTHALVKDNLVGLCRKKHTNLRQTTLRTLLRPEGDLPPVLPEGTYSRNKSEQIIKLHNGGEIHHFGFDEWTRIGSLNLGAVFIDEGIELDEEEYTMLLGRVRNAADPCRQVCIATNPGSPAHFLHNRFFENPVPTRRVIHTTTLDNWFLPKDYLQNMENLDGAAYDRYVLGKWVAFEGAVYPMFRPQRHVLKHRGEIAEAVIGLDWGFANPFALTVIARAPHKGLHVATEIKKTGLTPTEMREIVLDVMKEYPVFYVFCDPSEPAMIEDFQRFGIPAWGADNDVMGGIRKVQDMLLSGKLTFSPECGELIKEMQSYRWKENQDKPEQINDHLIDALRYGVISWETFMGGIRGIENKEIVTEPENDNW